MKGSDSWSEAKSGLSQQLALIKEGNLEADVIIKALDSLLSTNNNLDNQSLNELESLIISAKLPPELSNQLLNKFDDQRTRLIHADLSTPHKNSATKNIESPHPSHSAALLRDLLQWNENEQIKPFESGQTIRNTYCLESKIGSGGMGEVWKALDLIQDAGDAKDINVAIKFIKHEIRSHPDILKALVREFSRYKKLIHPNIVKAYELNRDNNDIFIVMEYLQGGALKEFIKEHPKGISLAEAQPIIKGMCSALEYAHNEGIVHLDFKPGNVFYDPETQTCKVIDFGIARLSSSSERDETRFDPGSLGAMTTAYASAEMLMEADPDPRDDIYGLACVVYQLLSGQHPFNKKSSLKAKGENMQPKKIPGLSKVEFLAIQHGLSFDRDKRTASAQQFFSELFLPQQLVVKQRSRWIIMSALVALAIVIIPTILYKAYNSWQINQVKTSIQQQLNSSIEGFLSLSVDEQNELLNDSSFRLALVKHTATQVDPDKTILNLLDDFGPNIQQILFADRKVREYLISYFSNKIDQAIEEDDFQMAEQLSLRILEQYPDSMRLVESSQNLKQKKETRQTAQLQRYQFCLSDSTRNLTELFPCLKQTRSILGKINNNNLLLTADVLTNRYNKEISFAIRNKNLTLAEELLADWKSLEPSETSLRTRLENQLAYTQKVSELTEQIIKSNNLQLSNIVTRLPTLDSVIKESLLANVTVKKRLFLFYKETATHFLDGDNFTAALQRISEGITLFSKNRIEQKYLKRLAKRIDQKKSKYLNNLNDLYNKQISAKEPDSQTILNIQQKVSVTDPGNPLIQLPGLTESYSKKIEVAIVNDQFDLAQRLLNNWKLLKPSDSSTEVYIRLTEKNRISKAKKVRINNLLNKSRSSINADILDGSAIFSPLFVINSIDKEYLNEHSDIFQELKLKLFILTNQEKPLPQLKNVINQWEKFLSNAAHQSIKNQELLRKTKNQIALRCLFRGRKLKAQNQQKEANELFSFALSLDPVNSVRNALERDLSE